MAEARELVRIDRVRALLRTRNDYVERPVYSDDPSIEVTQDSPAKVRTLSPRERDREIARLERMASHREGLTASSDKEWWERQKEARDRSGSYVALDECLKALTSHEIYFLDRYYEGLVKRTPSAQAMETEIVSKLARMMPERIELPHGLYYQHSEKLRAIVRSIQVMNAREISRHLGIGRNLVKRLLRQTS